MHVAAILNAKGHDVATIGREATLSDVVAELTSRRIGAIVVVEDGDRIVGIISERDIVHSIGRRGMDVLAETVDSVMTRDVVTCRERDSINEIMERMTDGRVRHLPVVRQGRLIGIISIGDVVKARMDEVEREAEEMRTYIATA